MTSYCSSIGKDDLFSSVEIIAEHGVDTVDRTDSDISVVDNYITRSVLVLVHEQKSCSFDPGYALLE